MSRDVIERIKTILIVVLIAAGLLQVGILWEYQSQGTPTSFFMRFFGEKPAVSDTVAREKLFVPDRLILSNGKRDHWIINNDEDFYYGLWEEVKQGLEKIASGDVNLTLSNEEWGNIVENRGYIIDFSYVINSELMRWFLGIGVRNPDLPEVSKLMVKTDIVNENRSTFYICTSSGVVYVSNAIIFERSKTMDSIFKAIEERGSQKLRSYYTFRGSKIDKSIGAEPDVLHVISSPSYWPYYSYVSTAPAKASKKEELAEIFLGNEKDRYNKSMNNAGTIQFNYGSNVYRYYTDGYMTYQYLGSADTSGKTGVGEALLKAYKFISDMQDLVNSEAEIRLTKVEQLAQGIYAFSFDYRLKGMAVRVELDTRDGEDALKHAIEIQVDSNRVLKCNWIIRNFTQKAKGDYNDRFWDLDLVRLTGLEHEELSMRDMRPGYFINSTTRDILRPMFIIDMKDGTFFALEMPVKEGE